MKKAKGFTLVELLVVIGIIAVLISILLPSLNRARWQAQMVACTARLHDLMLAITMYANDNKGFLPPYPGDTGKANFSVFNTTGGVGAESIWRVSDTGNPNNPWAKNDAGANLGRLYRTKYIKVAREFACPSVKSEIDFENTARHFSYYTYNPHVKWLDSSKAVMQIWWKRLPNYGKVLVSQWDTYSSGITTVPNMPVYKRALIMDSVSAFSGANQQLDLSHVNGIRRGFNLAYADGSVISYYANNWTARQGDGKWNRVTDITNAIMHAADGGNVQWTGAWQNTFYNAFPVNPG
jgi:prepilin-type N-terminal cleavage/methylation domain-containing protein